RFAVFTDNHRSCCQFFFSNFCFAENGKHTSVCILHIRRGVTFERQHIVPVEDIVSSTVFGKISIFHRTDTDRIGQFFQFVSWHIRVLLCHQTACTLQCFIQQIRQFH